MAAVAALATAGRLELQLDPAFDESADPTAGVHRIRALGAAGGTTVICSQGGQIPRMLVALGVARAGADRLVPDTGGGAAVSGWATAKGDGWLLPFSGGRPLAAMRLGRSGDPLPDFP